MKKNTPAIDATAHANQTAELKAARATIAAMKESQNADLMDQFEDRIAPTMVASVAAWGKQLDDPAKFKTYLEGLPRVSRVDRQSLTPDVRQDALDTANAVLAEQEICKFFGITKAKHRKLSTYGEKIAYVRTHDNTAVLFDGTEVPVADIDAHLGLK
jgi:hypothetical protein